MADAVDEIVDLQAEIKRDAAGLMALKQELTRLINAVENAKYRKLLDYRYVRFMT